MQQWGAETTTTGEGANGEIPNQEKWNDGAEASDVPMHMQSGEVDDGGPAAAAVTPASAPKPAATRDPRLASRDVEQHRDDDSHGDMSLSPPESAKSLPDDKESKGRKNSDDEQSEHERSE